MAHKSKQSPFRAATAGLRGTFLTVYAAAEPVDPDGQWSKAQAFIDDTSHDITLRHAVTGDIIDPTGLLFATKGRSEKGRTMVARQPGRSVKGGGALAGSTMCFTLTRGKRRSAVKWGSLLDCIAVFSDQEDFERPYTDQVTGVTTTVEMKRDDLARLTVWAAAQQ